MIRTIAILCLVAPAFGISHGSLPPDHRRPLQRDHKIKQGLKVFDIRTDSAIDLPLSNHSASMQGYIKMNRPRLPGGYCSLQLWCRKDDYRFCIFTDENGDVVGVQLNIPVDEFTPKYDMKDQGFTIWTTTLDYHHLVRFYAFFQFFVAPDKRKRFKSKDDSTILRDSDLHYSGFGGKLASVATENSKLNRIFTKQNCVRGLGHQYSYNMTKNLECSASSISPFSIMYYDGQITGSKVTVVGSWVNNSQFKDGYEKLNRETAMYAVPNGPRCLHDGLKEGAIFFTVFYISSPWRISCDFNY